jgi:hypothetical protein
MSHRVHVAIRGSSDTIDGPSGTQEEAERQLNVIRDTLGRPRTPDLPWLAAMGKDILSARVINDDNIGIA